MTARETGAVEILKRELERQKVPFARCASENVVFIYNSPALDLAAMAAALTRPQPTPSATGEIVERFWLVLREPGRVPERKGPWPKGQEVAILREFIAARPTSYIDVLTLDCFGHPQVDHGPEVLQMLDGRSMTTGAKHNERARKAHEAHHGIAEQQAATIAELRADREAILALIDDSVERWRPSGGEPLYIDGYETGAADACIFLAEDIRRGPPYPLSEEARATLERTRGQ